MRIPYLCERKGLPPLKDQRAALVVAGLTEDELREPYVDRRSRKPGQPERDYIVGAAREGDEIWVSRPAVVATTRDDALAFLAAISDHGAVLCIASNGARYHAPEAAQAAVRDGLNLAAAIAADERAAVMERARRGLHGKPAGKPRISADRLEAARAVWFDHAISSADAAERTGIASRTLHRHFGKRGSPAFGAALNKRRGK
jgi:hypothetical protein